MREEMRYELIELAGFTVGGVQRRFSAPNKEDPGFEDIWMNRFTPRWAEIESFCTDKGFYGVWFGDIGLGPADYLAGMSVERREEFPGDLVMRDVPASTYAVFECTVRTIGETYDAIFGEWLSDAAHERDRDAPHFEYYPPGTSSQDSPVLIHMPVRRGRAA
jgi:predicted transcriptional regulator YdeE